MSLLITIDRNKSNNLIKYIQTLSQRNRATNIRTFFLVIYSCKQNILELGYFIVRIARERDNWKMWPRTGPRDLSKVTQNKKV